MFDEMHTEPGDVRAHYRQYAHWLATQPESAMRARREEAFAW